jgi:hypothetical protein
MHGEGKERKDHPRAHYQEEPTITFLVFSKYQDNREYNKGKYAIKHTILALKNYIRGNVNMSNKKSG